MHPFLHTSLAVTNSSYGVLSTLQQLHFFFIEVRHETSQLISEPGQKCAGKDQIYHEIWSRWTNFNEKIGPADHYFRGTIFHVTGGEGELYDV